VGRSSIVPGGQQKDVNDMSEMSETDRVINRHTARLLSELEDAGCPIIFRDAVKSKLAWLRSDLNEVQEKKQNAVHKD